MAIGEIYVTASCEKRAIFWPIFFIAKSIALATSWIDKKSVIPELLACFIAKYGFKYTVK